MDSLKQKFLVVTCLSTIVGGLYLFSHNKDASENDSRISLEAISHAELAPAEKLPVSETEYIAQQEAELDEIYFSNQLEEEEANLELSQEVLPTTRQLPQNEEVGIDEVILDSDSLLEASLLDVASNQQNVVPTRTHDKTLASISTEVMAIDGTLSDGFAYKENCSADPCTNNIIEIATDKIVWNGTWQAGFLPTYNGKQVIRVNTGA